MPTDVETLMEMGFPENRAQKALAKSGYKGFQAALDWLFAHQDDPDIDDPFEVPKGHSLMSANAENEGGDQPEGEQADQNIGDSAKPEEPPAEAKSLKCDDCGKLLSSEANLQMHAARTGHSNFSESTEEIKPLTEEEKKEQLARLQEKLNLKREERARKEREEALEREKIRRKQGREYGGVKQKMEEDEMKKIMAERKREKMEEKLAKQRVKEQIERDRAARNQLFPGHGKKEEPQQSTASPAAPAATSTQAPPKEYDKTRLQIRLLNGQPLTESFSVNEQLASVRLFVQMKQGVQNESPTFTFMTTFPKKVFTEDDMQISLKQLGLVPSAVLMVKDL